MNLELNSFSLTDWKSEFPRGPLRMQLAISCQAPGSWRSQLFPIQYLFIQSVQWNSWVLSITCETALWYKHHIWTYHIAPFFSEETHSWSFSVISWEQLNITFFFCLIPYSLTFVKRADETRPRELWSMCLF